MIKKIFGRKLSRSRPAREALFSGLVKNLVVSDKIVTTKAKAKSIQGFVEKLITKAKVNNLSSFRFILAKLDNSKSATKMLVKKANDYFSDRKSGYTRIVNLKSRRGDNAQMVRLELLSKKDENSTTESK